MSIYLYVYVYICIYIYIYIYNTTCCIDIKYIFQVSYMYLLFCAVAFCHLPKLKMGMALAFSADFLYTFFHRNVPY